MNLDDLDDLDDMEFDLKFEIQWMFTRFITDPIRKVKWFFKRRDLVRTGLAKTHYIDTVSLMLYANMEMLVDFVENEIDIVDWSWAEPHMSAKSEIDAIYVWWKNYPNRLKENENALNVWWESLDRTKPGLESTPESKKHSDYHHHLEQLLHDEEQEYLKRLIDVRDFLWT